MESSFWHRQSADKPLFPDLLWSRPENRLHAGKLLVVGGNAHGFSAPAEAFNEAGKAGVGTARVVLPDALQKTVGKFFPEAEFVPSTPSGSLSQKALGELLALGQWADGVLLAGDLGRNSETAILLEKFTKEHTGQLSLTKDSADYFLNLPQILDRPDTTLVVSFAQLQKLAIAANFTKPFTFDMDLVRLVDMLHDFTEMHPASIMVKHLRNIIVAVGGQVSTTKLVEDKEVWRVATAAHASVWWLQNSTKPFEALTTSIC